MSSSLVPDYEVKFLLKPSAVLKSDKELKDEVVSAFKIPSSSTKMNIQFVDTKRQDIYTEGWSLRIRKIEGKKKFELTYKKRYPIDGEFSATTTGTDVAIKAAKNEGFDESSKFEAQVEVGHLKQTLSVSYDKKVGDTDPEDMDLPPANDSRKLLSDNAPEKFKSWKPGNWGTDHLATSIIYGPVLAKRYEGTLEKGTPGELKVFIEVWPIRKSKIDKTLEPIVEASFKAEKLKKPVEARAQLLKLLQENCWFLAEDSLRTKLIMERYGESA